MVPEKFPVKNVCYCAYYLNEFQSKHFLSFPGEETCRCEREKEKGQLGLGNNVSKISIGPEGLTENGVCSATSFPSFRVFFPILDDFWSYFFFKNSFFYKNFFSTGRETSIIVE